MHTSEFPSFYSTVGQRHIFMSKGLKHPPYSRATKGTRLDIYNNMII